MKTNNRLLRVVWRSIWFAVLVVVLFCVLTAASWLACPWCRYKRLDRAIYSGNVKLVHLYLLLGCDVNGRDYRPVNSVEPNVPLMSAVFKGRQDIAALLLEKGANPNFQYGEGVSPLAFAAGRGDVKMLKLLLSHGARKDMQTFDGTALDVAIVQKQEEAVRVLKGGEH